MKKTILYSLTLLLLICCPVIAAEDTAEQSDNSSPLILESFMPVFPVKAETAHIEGFVTLRFTVTKYGKIEGIEVVDAVPAGYFEDSALTALKNYRFKPAMKNGESIDYTLELPFVFSFPGNSLSGDGKTRLDTYRYLNKGIDLLKKGDYQNAIKEFSEAIKLEPAYKTAHFYRSEAYTKLEQYDKALSDIDKAIGNSTTIFAYYNQRGLIYLLKKEYEKAIENLDESIKIAPNLVAYIHRGDCYRMLNEYEKAIDDYTDALVIDGSLIHVNNNRGVVFYKMKDTENACRDFKTACNLGDCRAFDHFKKNGTCE